MNRAFRSDSPKDMHELTRKEKVNARKKKRCEKIKRASPEYHTESDCMDSDDNSTTVLEERSHLDDMFLCKENDEHAQTTVSDEDIFCGNRYDARKEARAVVKEALRTVLGSQQFEDIIAMLSCDNPECNKSEISRMRRFKKCSRCITAYYCSKECQKADWPTHRTTCVEEGDSSEEEEDYLSLNSVTTDSEFSYSSIEEVD